MLKILSGILSTVIYNILCYMFFDTFSTLTPRKKTGQWLILGVATSLSTISAFLFAYHTIAKQIITIVIISLAMYLLFDLKLYSAFLFECLFHASVILIEFMAIQVLNETFSPELLQQQNSITMTMLSILCQLVQFLLIVILRKYAKTSSGVKIREKEWLIFSIFPIFTIITLLKAISQYGLIRDAEKEPFLIYMAFGLIAMNFIMYYLMCEIIRRDSLITHAKVMKEKGIGELNLYGKLTENYEVLQKRVHEFDNELAVIQSLADADNTSKIKTYISELRHKSSDYKKCIETNNPVVDAILNAKYREALQENITFVIKINDLSGILMTDEDTAVLLSNLLNNALEAAVKTDKKIVRFKCELNDENIIIAVANSSIAPPVIKNDNYITTKADTSRPHGIGTKNIKDVINKYAGDYIEDYSDGFFTLTMIIKNHLVSGSNPSSTSSGSLSVSIFSS